MSAVDAVTDLACEYVRLNDGLVHRGIKVAADYLAAILIPRLPEWVADRAPAHIIVVGHSLGAGTATLLTMLLKDHVLAGLSTLLPPSRPPLQLHCYAYGPPPTCSRNLADAYADQITVLVNEHDIVCRLSYGSVIDLRTCLLAAVAGIDNHATEVLSLLTRSSSSNRRRNGLPALPVDDRLQAIFDVITQTRATLQETQINPKLYLAGKVYRVHYDYQQLGSSTPSTESLSGPTSIPVSPPIERTASPAPVAPEPLSASGVMGIGAAAPSTTIAKTQALGTTVSMSASPPPLLDTSHTSGGSLPRLVSHARRASAEVFKTLFPRSNSSSIAQTGSAASTDAATASQGSLLADVPTATEVQGVPVPPLSRSPSSNSSNKGGDPSPRANSPRTASPSGTAAVGVECGPVPWAAMGLFATPMMQPRPTFATPRPEPTATVPPPPTTEDSTSAGESAILPDPAPSASMPGLLTSPTTGSTAPAVAVPTKGGVVKVPMRVVLEETPCEALAELEVRRNMFVQHMPDAYERALSRWLASDEDQLD
ncbi:hypothetical protein BC828DRAFT_49561 [Blastocladiella britannica]|nr:hypothetical protein BC828DRAFT_49561 [Blastocladiella britannica]